LIEGSGAQAGRHPGNNQSKQPVWPGEYEGGELGSKLLGRPELAYPGFAKFAGGLLRWSYSGISLRHVEGWLDTAGVQMQLFGTMCTSSIHWCLWCCEFSYPGDTRQGRKPRQNLQFSEGKLSVLRSRRRDLLGGPGSNLNRILAVVLNAHLIPGSSSADH